MLRALAFTLSATTAAGAFAQACCAPTVQPTVVQPTIAYSPVVAAPAPAVYQATTVSNSWYPGKYLGEFSRNLFGVNETTTVVAPAPVVANYAPTAYTAGYAPTSYAAGYAPTSYVAGYTPSVAYRPTYPATYGPVTRTVNRPVVLSPVMSSPVVTASACNACSTCGVEQAYFDGGSSSCSACTGGSSYIAPSESYGTNPPRLAPGENVPDERSNLKPEPTELDEGAEPYEFETQPETTPVNPSASSDYFSPPPLFAPPSNNNVARRRHPAPVRTAVYRESSTTGRTALRPASGQATDTRSNTPRPPIKRLSSAGWKSATD